MEQDRAPAVLVHYPELARQAAGQLPGHRPTDCRDHDAHRPEGNCEIDTNTYPAGVKVTDAEMEAINLPRHDFHGEWNYTIKLQNPPIGSDSS